MEYTQQSRGFMKISELARACAVSKDTIRLYTKLGLISCQQKVAGSRFYAEYDKNTIDLVKGIRMAQSIGFTLAELRPLADEYTSKGIAPERERILLQTKLKEIADKQKHLALLGKTIQSKLDKL
jgi:MerR family transcriptional regulator, copper efflux regulator